MIKQLFALFLFCSLGQFFVGAVHAADDPFTTAYSQSPNRSATYTPSSANETPAAPLQGPSQHQLQQQQQQQQQQKQQQAGAYTLPNVEPSVPPPSFSEISSVLNAPPAWAQTSLSPLMARTLLPFGSNLFQGNFTSTYSADFSANYVIQSGDHIGVRIWGAKMYEGVLIVDQQGNIFLPEIGPISVGGIPNSKLSAQVRSHLAATFTDNVNVYVNLQSPQPVAVYVTGFVNRPGRYAGGSQDPIMSYIDRAGGIMANRGSFRNIKIIRKNKSIATFDLYRFVLEGKLPTVHLLNGDSILVEECQTTVAATGLVRQEALYELVGKKTGKNLIEICSPMPGVSHVSLSGIRKAIPINRYMNLEEFSVEKLEEGDNIDFVAANHSNTILVSVNGAIEGASRFPVQKGTTLKGLLPYVEIDSDIADASAVYIRRQSVAIQQKAILKDSLKRLEQSALTATSSTNAEASIRLQEATLIQDFVKRAASVEPDGVVVVSHDGELANLLLENKDIVIIPQTSHVVQVSGEVMIPKAIAWNKQMDLKDYIAGSGGFSNRADKGNILIVRMNGEVGNIRNTNIAPGDRILVMPRFDSKNVELVASITQILYQIAIATSVVVGLE